MPLSFTQARVVEAGDLIRAGDLASLAQAINTRRWSGVGDWDWRLGFYFFSGLFRKVRKDSGSLATPEAEFFNFYQMLEPEDAEWPTAGPDDPEGANVANHMCAFVCGSAALSLAAERVRLEAVPATLPPRAEDYAFTLADYWELAKAQRGAFDPVSGAGSSPMTTLGTSYGYIRSSLVSPHGNSYGGYFPRPEDAEGCAAIDDYTPPNWQIYFTNLETGEVRTYPGTCPEDMTHVAWVSYTPFAYVVFLNDGSVDYLPKSEWIEGPYTQEATLSKASANAISRAVAEYAAGYRGDAEQRRRPDLGQRNAFRTQEFLANQYALAPQIGAIYGDSIVPLYPRFEARGTDTLEHAAGALPCTFGGMEYGFPAGTKATHLLVAAVGLAAGGVTLDICDGAEIIASVTLTPNGAGEFCDIVRLSPARHFGALRLVAQGDFRLVDAAGFVMVETTCLLDYTPQLYDLYAYLRRSTYRGGDGLDGRGVDESQANVIYANYARYGAAIPNVEIAPGLSATLNRNAVFDAARELSKCVRILPRHQLVGYGVEDGVSVVYLRRWAFGMSHGIPIDLLKGIGPTAAGVASGDLQRGREYEVASGEITYGTSVYHAGQTFTATAATFSGTGTVREANGIHAAFPGGFSNGWTFSVPSLKPYYWSPSSIWKPESYADSSPFIDRCTMDSPETAYDNAVLLHVAYGERPTYFSETPSGFRYMPTPLSSFGDYANQGASVNFMKSCRVYEPPLRVLAATIDDEWTAARGEQIVKLVLSGRVHHHTTLAPASIDPDPANWDATNLTDLAAEVAEFRTVENGLREYLAYDQRGRNASNAGAGDAAMNSALPTSGDVFGSALPALLLVQDIPEPYLDGNATVQPSLDAPALSEYLRRCELYLRAGCEGFVDGRETASQVCDHGTTTVYDYTFENLIFDAVGNRHVPLLPASVVASNPQGHGPLPMTVMYASTFATLAAAVNRLTRARLMLPARLQYQTTTTTRTDDVTSQVFTSDGARNGLSSTGASSYAVWLHTAGQGTAGTEVVDPWVDGDSASVATVVGLSVSAGSVWLETSRQSVTFRWAIDGGFEDALPPDLAATWTGNTGVLLRTTEQRSYFERTVVSGETNGDQCHTGALADTVWGDGAGNASLFNEIVESDDPVCVGLGSTVNSGTPPAADVAVAEAVGSPSAPDCMVKSIQTVAVEAVTATPVVIVPTVEYSDGD